MRPDTFDDTYWKHQQQIVRPVRLITDYQSRKQFCDTLRNDGVVVDTFIWEDQEGAYNTMEERINSGNNEPGLPPPSLDVKSYPIDPTLLATTKPFQYSNKQADPANHDAIGTSYHPTDTPSMEIGSEYTDPSNGHIYEKLLVMPEDSDFANATADPTAFPGAAVPYWYRVG